MAGDAVHWRHSAYLHVVFLMADVADGPRSLEAMQGNRMALYAGNVLLLSVHQVPGGGGYLEPPGITTLVTFFTSFIRNYSVPFYSLKIPEGKIKNQLGTGKRTLLVAAMAAYVPVLAGGPAVPGLLHDVAGAAEIGVLLHIVIEMDKLVATKGDGNQDNDRNRYSYLLRESTHPVPEVPYTGSEPVHLLSLFSISLPSYNPYA